MPVRTVALHKDTVAEEIDPIEETETVVDTDDAFDALDDDVAPVPNIDVRGARFATIVETAAWGEARGVEELEPRECIGLVAAQLAVETIRCRRLSLIHI